MENAKTIKDDFKGTTANKKELREGEYFQTAKLTVLVNYGCRKKAHPQSRNGNRDHGEVDIWKEI
jgi:hypothetical protein